MSPETRPAGAGAGDERLRREDRLRKAREFRAVSRRGTRVAGRRFVVVSGDARDPARLPARREGPRLGLAVGRRVGSAVVRNAVKRRIREWFRRGGRQCLAPDRDLVVIARAGAGALGGRGVADELDRLCGRLGGRSR